MTPRWSTAMHAASPTTVATHYQYVSPGNNANVNRDPHINSPAQRPTQQPSLGRRSPGPAGLAWPGAEKHSPPSARGYISHQWYCTLPSGKGKETKGKETYGTHARTHAPGGGGEGNNLMVCVHSINHFQILTGKTSCFP